MTDHFAYRVMERIGTVDPDTLREGLVWAIEQGRSDLVEFVCRVSKNGRRLFKFRVPDGRFFFALIDTGKMIPITVMPPDFKVVLAGKRILDLRSVSGGV